MGNAPGYVVIVGAVVIIALSIKRSGRKRDQRKRTTAMMAEVLGGSVDKQQQAVGTYRSYGVQAHLSHDSGSPSDLPSSDGSSRFQVHRLHVRLHCPSAGGGMWACRRDPSLIPGRPTTITWVRNPTGFLPGASTLLGRLGVEPVDEGTQQRLVDAGLFRAVGALGEGASPWNPQVSRSPSPDLPPALVAQMRAAGHDTGDTGGSYLMCALELTDGPDLTPERFRGYLDAIIRIAEIDASANP